MPKTASKFWKKRIFFDFSKWPLMMICHHRSVSKHPPDFRELFSSYIELPNSFFWKNIFWLQNCLWEAIFHYRACESLENELLWCSLQNRNVNTRSFGESVNFGGWKIWKGFLYVSMIVHTYTKAFLIILVSSLDRLDFMERRTPR